MATTQSILAHLSDNNEDYTPSARLRFIISCLTGGLEAPLYQEIREKRGLSYFSAGDIQRTGESVIGSFLAITTNERADELKQVYTDFFSDQVSRHITLDRFIDCKESFLIKKRVAELLPYSGIGPKVLSDYNSFVGVETLNYNDCLTLADATFNMDTLMMIEY
jgi:hypothetical protein